MQHYAFLIDDDLFDRAYRRLCDRGVEHWADPQMRRPGETNDEHGGRGVYFKDPAGHAIELITRPYLSAKPVTRAERGRAPDTRRPVGDPPNRQADGASSGR